MMIHLAIIGAGGNMGRRVTRALKEDAQYRLYLVEPSETGRARLAEMGMMTTERDEALAAAEAVVMAVPDRVVSEVAHEIVPRLKPGTLLMSLDPAAGYAGKLPGRADVSYFVCHPTHPPLYDLLAEPDAEARKDYWGHGLAQQALVCALTQGPEADYVRGEQIAIAMFKPISRSHRITIEQMAILEPAMAETTSNTCLSVIKEAMDEAVRRGVPEAAAYDFMMGHIQLGIAIIFGATDWKLSAGAQQAIDEAMPYLIQPDWKQVFDRDQLMASVRRITGEQV
jgi:hypothetical protein